MYRMVKVYRVVVEVPYVPVRSFQATDYNTYQHHHHCHHHHHSGLRLILTLCMK
jgi:hypothetical protein